MSDLSSSVCGARTRAGTPCQKPPMANGRCRLHGGLTPAGISSPHYVHGKKIESSVKASLHERYHHSFSSILNEFADKLVLDEEVALAKVRVREVVGHTKTGESKGFVLEANRQSRKISKALADSDSAALIEAANDLRALVRDGQRKERMVWDDVREWLDVQKKLVESERKRLLEAQEVESKALVRAVIGEIIFIVSEAVSEPDKTRLIGKIRELTMRAFAERGS